MAISTRWSRSPVTRPDQSPSIMARPSSSRPSSTKNEIAASSDSTTMPTLSIRCSATRHSCRIAKADEFLGGLSVSTAMRPDRAAWRRRQQMPRYLISFDAHAMDHIPEDDMPAVAKAAHEVVEEAMNAGVWVFGGGLENERASIVATDGTVADGPDPEAVGGVCVCDVPSREEALA